MTASPKTLHENGALFSVGTHVMKKRERRFPSVIVSVFENTRGEVHYVVECIETDDGFMRIVKEDEIMEYDNVSEMR